MAFRSVHLSPNVETIFVVESGHWRDWLRLLYGIWIMFLSCCIVAPFYFDVVLFVVLQPINVQLTSQYIFCISSPNWLELAIMVYYIFVMKKGMCQIRQIG